METAKPFWMLEYLSKNNKRKDYDDNFDKYERHLNVPYYLTIHPDDLELTLYHYEGNKHVSVKPNDHGRYAVPELKIEVALRDGWACFWYYGKLLPLPADLQESLHKAKRELSQEKRRAQREKKRADNEARRADEEKRRADALQNRVKELERPQSQRKDPE